MSPSLITRDRQPSTGNRRLSPRQALGACVLVFFEPDNWGKLVNISEKGMGLEYTQAPPAECESKFAIEALGVDSTTEILAEGRLVWTDDRTKTAGIQFLNLTENAQQQITKWLSPASSPVIENTPRVQRKIDQREIVASLTQSKLREIFDTPLETPDELQSYELQSSKDHKYLDAKLSQLREMRPTEFAPETCTDAQMPAESLSDAAPHLASFPSSESLLRDWLTKRNELEPSSPSESEKILAELTHALKFNNQHVDQVTAPPAEVLEDTPVSESFSAQTPLDPVAESTPVDSATSLLDAFVNEPVSAEADAAELVTLANEIAAATEESLSSDDSPQSEIADDVDASTIVAEYVPSDLSTGVGAEGAPPEPTPFADSLGPASGPAPFPTIEASAELSVTESSDVPAPGSRAIPLAAEGIVTPDSHVPERNSSQAEASFDPLTPSPSLGRPRDLQVTESITGPASLEFIASTPAPVADEPPRTPPSLAEFRPTVTRATHAPPSRSTAKPVTNLEEELLAAAALLRKAAAKVPHELLHEVPQVESIPRAERLELPAVTETRIESHPELGAQMPPDIPSSSLESNFAPPSAANLEEELLAAAALLRKKNTKAPADEPTLLAEQHEPSVTGEPAESHPVFVAQMPAGMAVASLENVVSPHRLERVTAAAVQQFPHVFPSRSGDSAPSLHVPRIPREGPSVHPSLSVTPAEALPSAPVFSKKESFDRVALFCLIGCFALLVVLGLGIMLSQANRRAAVALLENIRKPIIAKNRPSPIEPAVPLQTFQVEVVDLQNRHWLLNFENSANSNKPFHEYSPVPSPTGAKIPKTSAASHVNPKSAAVTSDPQNENPRRGIATPADSATSGDTPSSELAQQISESRDRPDPGLPAGFVNAPPPPPAESSNQPAIQPDTTTSTVSPATSKTVQPAVLISSSPAVYPSNARASKTQGDVVVDAQVDETGHLRNMRVVSGPVALRQAALESLLKWRYQPARLRGQIVTTPVRIIIKFNLQ